MHDNTCYWITGIPLCAGVLWVWSTKQKDDILWPKVSRSCPYYPCISCNSMNYNASVLFLFVFQPTTQMFPRSYMHPGHILSSHKLSVSWRTLHTGKLDIPEPWQFLFFNVQCFPYYIFTGVLSPPTGPPCRNASCGSLRSLVFTCALGMIKCTSKSIWKKSRSRHSVWCKG